MSSVEVTQSRGRPLRLVRWLAVAAGVIALVVWFSRWTGQQVARDEIERLNLVFGDVFRYSVEDRVVMVAAARSCKLFEVAKTAEAVVTCLRAGAASSAYTAPLGVERPKQRLETLLDEAIRRRPLSSSAG